ncbi:ketopantoate reductase family protein [Halomonas ramblicola]|uniref:ketopantoate reductase family protein n=1 Tax=Halomonas ramblicola TaxID=747349 RepID=UPI0025B4D6D8|nr:2-dehydropantoate 2-reductase [Halomonas ramblicola]MDN3523025.1 2-dehydropantoate 2-reductase [Halomonas ramblicola]
MKYVIFGGGAIGSVLASYMAMAGKDITLITRGTHFEAIREQGYLELYYAPEGTHHQSPVRAMTEQEYDESPDVVIICVKSYSINTVFSFLDRVCRSDTVVLPLINALDIGANIEAGITSSPILAQGEAYVASELVKPGYCKHKLDFFRIVFGPRDGQEIFPQAEQIQKDLIDSGCTTEVSEAMLKEALKKFCRVSSLSGALVHFNATTGDIARDPEKMEFLAGLVRELAALGRAANAEFDEQQALDDTLTAVREVDPEYRTSLMYDYEAGKPTESRTMFGDVYEMGQKLGLEMLNYGKVLDKLRS